MADNSIPKQVLNSLGQIVVETGKEAMKQAGEITTSIITGEQLLGDITPMSEADLQKKRMEEEQKKQKELADVRSQISGRNLEQEMKQVRQENEQEEQQKLREEQEKAEQERQVQMSTQVVIEPSSRPARGKMGGGQKKKQKPTDDQMTATGEFKGKVD